MNRTDAILFNFLEEYLSRLEGPIAVQVWPRCMALAKDVAGNIYGYKLQLFPMLRYVTCSGMKSHLIILLDV